MFTKRKIIRNRLGTQIYDRMLSATRKAMFRLVFALALASKITPTKLANAFDDEKTDDFAEKFSQKLIDKGRKQAEKKQKEKKKEEVDN